MLSMLLPEKYPIETQTPTHSAAPSMLNGTNFVQCMPVMPAMIPLA